MSPEVFLVDEAVVVDEVSVAGVVGRVDVDALHAAGEGHAEVAQRVKVVAFDDEVFPGGLAAGERGVEVEGDEVGIERFIALNLIGFPNEPEPRGIAPVAAFQQSDQFVFGKIVVLLLRHARLRAPSKNKCLVLEDDNPRNGESPFVATTAIVIGDATFKYPSSPSRAVA